MKQSNYTPKRRNRQEATGRANRTKGQTVPAFATREYGEWKPGGNPTGYFSCQISGYEVKLRFGMVWTAYCPKFKIEVQYTDRGADDAIIFLTDWLTAHIERPQASEAKSRQTIPAGWYLAEYHDIALPLADEMMRGR